MHKKNKDFQKELREKGVLLKKQAQKNLEKAKKDLKTAEKKVKTFMKENPAKAAAIAAGVGAIIGASIGALLGRGRRRR
ncbi:MAG: hypothetical protein ABIC19_04725 [Patescibacteria group bacterium]|nr:hypothetical protein [Patescibacteria group bacterium]